MTTSTHSLLTGSDLHENHGAAAASDDTVATITSGGTVWKKLTAANLTGTGNSFGAALFHVIDRKNANTGGGTFTGSTWITRDLNLVLTNEISSASVSSSVLTIPAGTYFCEARAPAYATQGHRAQLYNATDAAVLIEGSTAYNTSAGGIMTDSTVSGRFTLSGSKSVVLRHMGAATGQLGTAANIGSYEIYSVVKIWQIA